MALIVAERGGEYTEDSLYSSAFWDYLLKIQPHQQTDPRSLSPPLAHKLQEVSNGSRLAIIFTALMTIPYYANLLFSSLITPID